MHHLSIDLETFSSVPIARVGAQKYIESPDFEILLFAYSLDGGPVELIDLARGEAFPPWLLRAIPSPEFTKCAYNASFEWGCLSKFLGPLPPDQWRCTMLHGLYCGYPAGLEAVGKSLGLPEDKAKLTTGRALIRYFCTPCKPTSANGQRTRNLPHHDLERWELFREYCRQDVTAEMEVERRLAAFPVPDFVQKQWETDLVINARGVTVDMELVEGALSLGTAVRHTLMAEATGLSGLDNPNSVAQLTQWLQEETGEELPDLRKDTVAQLLQKDENSPAVRRMLEIRQALGKTSTKKYNAIQAAVCADGRVRGLLQFYGANRTGRFAGRLIQVQNLPQNHLPDLDLVWTLIRSGQFAAVEMLYDSVPIVLSELIRTAFIPKPGSRFFVADFSAIEARVIAWIAGEQWRQDVFAKGGDIYCASASQMFHVPVEKHGRNAHLRQKGKIAELALGYGGSVGALKAMGALNMGVPEEELKPLVDAWRSSNPNITDFWWAVDDAAKTCVSQHTTTFTHDITFAYQSGMMFITLPSGRKLVYVKPKIGENRFGGESVTYEGVGGQKKWLRLESYGPKFVENIVQATARDILTEAMLRLDAKGYKIVMHVHDEVVIEAPPNTSLEDICETMAIQPKWADRLLLRADGYICDFYKKD